MEKFYTVFYLKGISERKEFSVYGDTLVQKECVNPQKQIYIYERYSGDRLICYEVVRGRKYKNPDGTIVYKYPSSEDWGKYGFTIYRNHKNNLKEVLEKLEGLGDNEN